jgi:DNA-binding CsgD family transcriptional regulator
MLIGRGEEIAAVDRLLERARSSCSGVLVVRGEAGIGKSALLEHARATADGMTVLRGVGIESESELAFAALHQILRPVLDRIERLPEPQAAALRSAFALSSETVDDRFRVSLAVLGILAEVAEERPLLCLVDDAQWLDEASADALLFAARRLEAEPIALLVAARDDAARPFPAPGLPELRLPPLGSADARALVAGRLGTQVAPVVVEWLLGHANGNALALVELPVALTAAQLAGREPLAGTVPHATSVEAAYLERIAVLAPAVRRLLVVAAAEETGDRATIAVAAADLGLDAAQLVEAEAAGVLRVELDRVEFRHPLMRSAVYRAAPFAERERAHVALADTLSGEADADRRAWHRAAAAVGRDDAVAAELEATADRAHSRGGYVAAATALERAAELTTDEGEQGRRLVAAAHAASMAGRDEDAAALAARAAPLVRDALLSAEIALVRGVGEMQRGTTSEAHRITLAAAREVAEQAPEKAIELMFHAAISAALGGDLQGLRAVFDLAPEIAPRVTDPVWTHLVGLMVGIGAVQGGDSERGARVIQDALAETEKMTDPRQLVWSGNGALNIGDDVRADALYARAASLARAAGSLGVLTYALASRAPTLLWRSRFDEAAVAATEAVRLGREIGALNLVPHPLAILAAVAAVRGREAEARELAEEALGLASAHGLGLAAASATWTVGLLDLARGRPEARERLNSLRDARPGSGHPLYTVLSIPDRIEAHVRAGRPDEARTELPLYEAWALHSGAQWALARLACCRALLAAGDEATAHYEEAVSLDDASRPLEAARIRLLYGEHLRRERRRIEAREQLRAALTAFERLGAVLWADRARSELRASGETARRRDPSTVSHLTPQELQIARLVSEGGSNKEIAGQLFLSPRTVEYHLRKVFSKLGITSRAELIRHAVVPEAVVAEPVTS